MISKLLFLIELGWKQVKSNTKLAFLIVVLFVFPLLFVVVLERFYDVAAANIQTVEMQSVGMFQDTVASIAAVSVQQAEESIATIVAQNPELTEVRLYSAATPSTVQIQYSLDADIVGTTGESPTLLKTALQESGQTFSTEVYKADGRYIQSARVINTPTGELFLFTEHSRVRIDTVLTQRKQDAYIVLSIIFVFLIGLAYWINRQSDWERKYKKLAGTLKERDLFSNMIAHEFRTPLTAIKGYASFLQEADDLTDEERRFADTIRESAERLVLLVNDFLEVARIQSGRMKLELAEIDVRKTITTVTDSLQEEAEKKGLHIIYTPALQPQLLSTDKNRLVQILTNIISNSIKYTEKGTVEISCEKDRKGVVVRVKDTGMGISAEDQKKLFAPFSRVGGVDKTGITGTGLGMWITKQMIEMLEGSIAVESIKNVGTHVVLHFENTAP